MSKELHMDDEDLVKRVLAVIHKPCKNQNHGNALWSYVGQLFGLGSTSAHRLCERHGYDPNIKVYKVLR